MAHLLRAGLSPRPLCPHTNEGSVPQPETRSKRSFDARATCPVQGLGPRREAQAR